MSTIINLFITFITKVHTKILTLNDVFGWAISDKWLHFIVIGVFGFCMLLAVQPIFRWLNRNGATVIISFIYVFTVVLVVTFAIEIGQAFSGTGDMDKKDILAGVAGFFVFFGIYLVCYLIYWKTKDEQGQIPNNDVKTLDDRKNKEDQ